MRLEIGRKALLILGFLVVLAGCGFHLRGNVSFPKEYQTAFVENNGPAYSRDGVEFYLKRQLGSELRFVNQREDADLIIDIDEGYDTRVTSSSLNGEIRGYTTDIFAQIKVTDSKGGVILPSSRFTRSRDFSIDEKEPLAKTTAEAAIKRNLADDLSRVFIRRLIAVMKAKQ
ncbi:LPS assembly lipoprotein LptE [Ignatzschineria cameli]|uniref:LPS-assembly lipoprotein LptE n=1 Tax=Ignatzschineria cameli TaxID=2182793 RepID=A0A2U2ASC9_9GAMM|nr:LPS assembly lipoprotein LptE [Ignatzschineria cameli]PWD86470.1 hypothetical protein DC080_02180 [Ignatzschineria cameli]PWD87176.1 hypothetical protein DC077_05070 [Ignatzschineria cameli]PWD92149.1 hypothetical protein DC079_02005 [Ignatzschineria cameli]PWD93266.1 hypothetical protein DC081_00180 [Ignatzschineria cameli]PWD94008.1 hypothetical protein DC078_00180 [Ignatzschineria cameli]